MSNKIGRFEILSELAHSEIGGVYKATDPDSNQTVALKTLKLESQGEQATALVQSLLQEAEASKVLNSHNIALLNGAAAAGVTYLRALRREPAPSTAATLAVGIAGAACAACALPFTSDDL